MTPTTFTVEPLPLTLLEPLLPRLLDNLSLARAQIAIDQLRSTIRSGQAERILFLTARRQTLPNADAASSVVAAAIAIIQPIGPPTDRDRDAIATLVHCGPLLAAASNGSPPEESVDDNRLIAAVAKSLWRELQRRDVTFLQLATDVESELEPTSRYWYHGLGLRSLAILEYFSGPVEDGPTLENGATATDEKDDSKSSLKFQAVDAREKTSFAAFANLVEQTYRGTLDCPELSDFRTATQTLRGYQASNAYNPRLWYRVMRVGENGKSEGIGCLILAEHHSAVQPDAARGEGQSANVIEIVYMGLVPTARGNRFGRQLIRQAMQVARQRNASRMILAVDRRNDRAIEIYQAAGFSPMLKETVWAASIEKGG